MSSPRLFLDQPGVFILSLVYRSTSNQVFPLQMAAVYVTFISGYCTLVTLNNVHCICFLQILHKMLGFKQWQNVNVLQLLLFSCSDSHTCYTL